MSQVQYPATVSRTVDPTKLSYARVVGLHDHKLADSDVNLIQDVADLKRAKLLADQTCSGVLGWAPFVFDTTAALTFNIPAFDVILNGEILTVGGNQSADLTTNIVTVPSPRFYTPGSSAPAATIYIVFLEAWYQLLDPATGVGYYVNPTTNVQYVSINGCINPSESNLAASDGIDPFMGVVTTDRVQLQWGIRVQPVALSYDFTKYSFGLDPGAIAAETVWGVGNQSSPTQTSPYQFTNMGAINGDTGLWRSGDGNVENQLGSMDGYTYAIPLAVVFQRNTGNFSASLNPFGCAASAVASSGLLASTVSGRYDNFFADVVYPSDVVDTRSTISLKSWDETNLLRHGFVDLISGKMQQKIARGDTPGSQSIALGSQLAYNIAVNSTAIANTDTVGVFDGFMNGFSSMANTSKTTKTVTVNQKVVGILGGRWQLNDAFSLSLPSGSTATITGVQVQGLVNNSLTSTKTPVLFLQGQINVQGLGTKAVTVTFVKNLVGTSYDPSLNPIYVTVSVTYPAASGMDLGNVPSQVYGGSLYDGASGLTLPVYGVSEYNTQASLAVSTAVSVVAINPEYSNTVFGTRVTVAVAASAGVLSTGASGTSVTTFSLTRTGLNGNLTGIYVISATDQASGTPYSIVSRSINGSNFALQLNGQVASGSTVLVTYLAANTAQLAYNAPVKGVTSIEETVLAGNLVNSAFRMDPRVQVVSVQNIPGSYNQVVLAATDSIISGIAGDDVNKLIWVLDTQGNLDAVQVSSATFSNGFITLNVPSSVNLAIQQFFVVLALLPAFTANSSLILTEYYVPYQGEGTTGRDYEIVHTEDFALVTTNGTGAEPVPGLKDVYPYNRELPIVTTLPAQAAWSDAGLANDAVASFFDSNYVAKRFQNVEHTFEVPVHTNDFIQPIGMDERKTFQLTVSGGGRGYSKAIPHVGFAIAPVTPRTVISDTVITTAGPVTLYVNNVSGSDNNDGLSVATAVQTIAGAVNLLPNVLRHPCSIQLIATGTSYSIASNQGSLEVMAYGDGTVLPAKYYALANIAFTFQDAGRLVISNQAGVTTPYIIDATSFTGFGDGPTSAFFIDNTRVIFSGIEFKGFTDPAIMAIDSTVEFIDCQFTDNITTGSFSQGSTVVMEDGAILLGNGCTGMILSQSDMTASGVQLTVDTGATFPGTFFVATYGSSVTLATHSPADETNISATTLIAAAKLNSSIVCSSDFSSQGSASLVANSVLSRTVAVNPFSGGFTNDASSSVTTSL